MIYTPPQKKVETTKEKETNSYALIVGTKAQDYKTILKEVKGTLLGSAATNSPTGNGEVANRKDGDGIYQENRR